MIGARVEESLPIPVSGRPKQPLVANGKFRGNGLYDLAVAASLEVAEIVATEQIECSTLSRDGQQVWIRSGLICQKQRTAPRSNAQARATATNTVGPHRSNQQASGFKSTAAA